MDVSGLALAAIISNIASATLVVISLCKRKDACKVIFKELRFSSQPLKKILRFGIPAGIQSATFSLSSGSLFQAAHAFGGQTFGAGNYKRLKRVYVILVLLGTAFSVIIAPLVLFFGEKLLGLYTVNSPEAIHWDMVRVVYIFSSLPVMVFMDTNSDILQK